MGVFADLRHVAGNMVAINLLMGRVRKIILEKQDIDISQLPEPLKSRVHEHIKQEYLLGNQDAAAIASSLSLAIVAAGVQRTSAVENPYSSYTKKKSSLEQAREHGRVLIVAGYREIARQRDLAPTSITSDDEIMAMYEKVGTAFHQAAEIRGERLSAGIKNGIVLYFLQIKESHGERFTDEHLLYEIQKYRREGLRDDYKREIDLLAILGLETDR